MTIRQLLRYLLEYTFTDEVFIETPSGHLCDKIKCRVKRNEDYDITGLIIMGEYEPLRCEITANLCGTDTWEINHPCTCGPCQRWLSDHPQKELREAIEVANGRTPEIL